MIDTRILLLIEDDQLLARSWRRALARHGWTVDHAASLAQARQLLGRPPRRPYAAVLLDLTLPDGCGEELLDDIEALAPVAPVAVVSGWLDAACSLRLIARQIVALPKPVGGEQLAELLDWLCSHGPRRRGLAGFCARHGLSRAEAAVLNASVAGLTHDEVAERLGCTPSTVATHWLRIRRKTGFDRQRDVLAALVRSLAGGGRSLRVGVDLAKQQLPTRHAEIRWPPHELGRHGDPAIRSPPCPGCPSSPRCC